MKNTTRIQRAVLALVVFLCVVPASALAYGHDYDWTSEISVSGSGVLTLPSAMLGESIFLIDGWTNRDESSLCFFKTNSFATPFSIASCNTAGTLYFTVDTTNTGTYPDGKLGFFYITRTEAGYYQTGAFPAVSGIDTITSPTPQQVTPDAFPRLTYTYTNVGLYVKASASITDLTISQNIEAVEEAITSNGSATYDEGMQLTANHFYSVQPFIEATDGSRIYGNLVFFSTVSDQRDQYSTQATTTEPGGLFGGTMNLRTRMMQKVPFGWVSQIYSAIASLTQSGTSTFPSVALHFHESKGAATTSITLFSADTIKSPEAGSFINTADNLMSAFIAFDALMLIYFVARTAFSPKVHHV